MPKLQPLPTRIISDIEELRPAAKDAIEWQRQLVRIPGLSDVERQIAVDVLVNLKVMDSIINRMRSREWDIADHDGHPPESETRKSRTD